MSYKVTPPNLRNSKSYVLLRKENGVREITTPAPEEKRGAASTVLLPNEFVQRKSDEMFENICSELKIVPGRVPGVSEVNRVPGRVPGINELKRVPGAVPGAGITRDEPRDEPSGDTKGNEDRTSEDVLYKSNCQGCDEPSGDMIAIEDMLSEDVLYGAEYVWKGRGYLQGSFREERSNAGGGKVDRPCKEHCFESLYHYQDCPIKTKATELVEEIDLFTEYSSKLTREFMGEDMSDYVVSSNNSLEMIGQEEFHLSNDKEVINNDMDADDIDAEGEEAYQRSQ